MINGICLYDELLNIHVIARDVRCVYSLCYLWRWQNFGFTFILGEKNKQDAITIGCKTADVKVKWIEAIRLAQYVVLSDFHQFSVIGSL